VVKPFQFTRNSGCLARDEFLVEGNHMLIYIFGFLFLFLVSALHCTALAGLRYLQSWINQFRHNFQESYCRLLTGDSQKI